MTGTNVPSSKLTTTAVATIILAIVGRAIEARTGVEWIPSPMVIDAVALAVGVIAGYFAPELFPPTSAVQALRRRT